jgi:hypothetical protein
VCGDWRISGGYDQVAAFPPDSSSSGRDRSSDDLGLSAKRLVDGAARPVVRGARIRFRRPRNRAPRRRKGSIEIADSQSWAQCSHRGSGVPRGVLGYSRFRGRSSRPSARGANPRGQHRGPTHEDDRGNPRQGPSAEVVVPIERLKAGGNQQEPPTPSKSRPGTGSRPTGGTSARRRRRAQDLAVAQEAEAADPPAAASPATRPASPS